jgi:hypothetical protein
VNRFVLLAPLCVLAAPSLAAYGDMQSTEKPIRILVGVFQPTAHGAKSALNLGIGYDFLKSKDKAPLIYNLYVDYNSRRMNVAVGEGTERRDVSRTGIGVSARLLTHSADNEARSYYGAGVGSYTVKNGTSKSNFGAKAFVGHELNSGIFAEADYTLISKVNGTDPSGWSLRAGFRF